METQEVAHPPNSLFLFPFENPVGSLIQCKFAVNGGFQVPDKARWVYPRSMGMLTWNGAKQVPF